MALVGKFVEEIMLQMQEKGFTQGEAELVPRFLERAIEELILMIMLNNRSERSNNET